MFERPILVFSNHCNYCKKFMDTLSKCPEIGDTFLTLCIDINPSTKRRPAILYEIQEKLNYKITEVPTIIVEDGQYVLSGEESFKWLEHTIKKFEKSTDLSGFNPNEMVGFSDNYSPYGSKEMNDASEQSFAFVNRKYDNIETPPEGSVTSNMDYSKKMVERDIVKMPSRSMPAMNFTDMSGNSGRGNVSDKQKEIDDRLQKLMSQRDELMPSRVPPKNINFSVNY